MAFMSFVVPVYKVDYIYLQYCVDSILGQSYSDIEAILVDDGSPDDCGRICDEYAKKDPRVKVVHKKNGGLSDARNAGTRVSTTDWVTYVDGDDWVEKDFAEHFHNKICQQDNLADMYFYMGCREYSQKTVEAIPYFNDCQRFETKEERELLQIECCKVFSKQKHEGLFIGSACGKIYNTSFLRNKGLHFIIVPYGEDSIFYLYSIEEAETIEYVRKEVYHYRDTDGSMVNKFRANAEKEQDIYLSEIFGFAKKYNKSEAFVDQLYYRVMISIQRCICQYFFNQDNKETLWKKQRDCCRFMKKEPYCEFFRYVKLSELNKNGKIKYLILKARLYFMLDISRSMYLKKQGTTKMELASK